MSDLTAFPENTTPKAAKDGVPGAPAAPAAPAAKAAGPARSQSNETGPEPGQSGISMVPIGFIRTPYGQKFAVPRQPRLAEVECEIEFYQPYCDPQAFIGLEGFSHIHVLFLFDREEVREFRPMVRPPRLGGNQRVGVFACRSPNRPNRMGLSILRLTGVDNRKGKTVLRVMGADMVDGTPVLDIKPYIPFVDSIPDAVGGFAQEPPALKQVQYSPEARDQLAIFNWSQSQVRALEQSLAQDPRPAYKGKAEDLKEYVAMILGVNVHFTVADNTVTVCRFTAPA